MAIKISFGESTNSSRISSLMGGIICLALSVLGIYVALFADGFGGGILFLPEAINSFAGRILFGSGALLTGSLAIYAFMEFFRNEQSDSF
ncbi:MAG: hypothetical protein JJU37_05080 [Balneolaceae bacterium]|nr:hypothetical protein [Balneolaceae bacterium]